VKKRYLQITPRTESLLQYILFAILVVLTPFIVVTKYLQGMVHVLSHFSFNILGFEIPIVLALAVISVIFLAIKYLKQLSIRKLSAILFVCIMIFTAHRVQDVLLDMSFFDLQQNWHYIAYGVYVFFFFRAFNVRAMPKSKMILYSYASALIMSGFDETFQFFLSNRVFDISDITKDAWGAIAGLILVFFVTETYGTIKLKNLKWWKSSVKEYFVDPATTLLFVFSLTLTFLFISPLLTEHGQWLTLCIIGFGTFALSALLYHFSQHLKFRKILLTLFVILIIGLTTSFVFNHDKNITYSSHGMTVYKGIPIPFFDIMIYPDGRMWLLDKKHHYGSQDKKYFFKQEPDILLIGSGYDNKGGKGFNISEGTEFIFNTYTSKGTQLIILPTPEANKKFNELRSSGKKVMFVIHTTC